MQITTKIGCKIACGYCPQDRLIKTYRIRSRVSDLSFDDFKTCADKIPLEVGIEFGGMSEPWLNPECTKMLLYVHEKGHSILVKTTTVGMNLSDIDLLEGIPFKLFQVHLPSNQEYEKISVDEDYLNFLDKMLKSSIDALFHYHGRILNPKVAALMKANGQKAVRWALHRRAGNMEVKHRPHLPRRRGTLDCRFRLRSNVLLPNGDVLLCSNDYGMKHVLGNLLTSEYASLYCGKEFLKIINGQKDGSADILCRYCDDFCFNRGMAGKANNWRYVLDRYLYYWRDCRTSTVFSKIIQKADSTFKTHFHF